MTTTSTLSASAQLAEFALGLDLADVPESVADYNKLVLMDSLICGLAASQLERSRMVQRVAGRIGGRPEATVFGLPAKVASINASHANADMMNALDADDTFFNSAHFAVFGAAAGLAEAERLQASGRQLLTANLAAFEVNARLNLATSLMSFEDGEFRWSSLSSHGYAGFGVAAACAVIGGLDADTLTSAFGLTGWLAPPAKNANLVARRGFSSFKYGPYGAITYAGQLASLLAEEGYVGDTDILDLEPGFIRGQGYLGTDRSSLTAGFHRKWWIEDTSLKPYPTCRFTHAALDAITDFGRSGSIDVDQIESIVVRLSPAAYRSQMFRDPGRSIVADHLAPLNGAFNLPYAMAVALLGHAPGPGWYSPELLASEQVWELARKITTSADPILEQEWKADLAAHPGGQIRRTRGSMTIRTVDQEYNLESDFCQGDPWQDETKADWGFVQNKFSQFCTGIISDSQQAELIDMVRHLEDVDNVAQDLSPLLTVRSAGN